MARGKPSWPARGAAALLALAAIGGCGSGSVPGTTAPPGASASAAPGTATANPTAADALSGYFSALDAHDAAAARGYLSPEFLQGFGSPAAFDGWVANYLSLRDLGVRAPQAPAATTAGQFPGYRDLVLYPVSYQAVVKQPSANEVTGRLERFVLLGRTSPSGPWLVLDVATSP